MFLYLFLFIAAFIYANFLEWILHKYVLHGLGKNKDSRFSSHWHTHHKSCRQNENRDSTYRHFPLHFSVKGELQALGYVIVAHTPLLFFAPFFYASLLFFSARYFYLHRKAHVNIEWGKQNLRWHYDHHMGKNQDANWGVTSPMWDYILGTRVKWPTSTHSKSETL